MAQTTSRCPLYQVPHTVDAMTVCCHPVFYCGKDHEIIYCTKDGGNDTCVPCPSGEINSYISSSLDVKHRVCFQITGRHECPEDNYPTAENESCKEMYCRCKTDECRYGNVCNMCYKKQDECGINEEINIVTGECEPCQELMYSPPGCGPCLYNQSAWRLSEERKYRNGAWTPTEGETKVTKSEVTRGDVSSSGTDNGNTSNQWYIIASDKPSNSSEVQANSSDGDGSMIHVIIIIIIIVIIGIFVALILYVIKKSRSGDHNSSLVVLYHRLFPRRTNRNQQDAESQPSNGALLHNGNMNGKRTQPVRPMVRGTGATVDMAGDGAEGVDGTNMALMKDAEEETRQKQPPSYHQS